MGKASSAKKVARAQKAGGTGKVGGRKLGFPMAVATILIVGIGLVVFARGQRTTSAVPPDFGDHWHAAYGVWACDTFLPPLGDQQGDQFGIHTHEDGLIHIHPTSSRATGTDATMGVFSDEVGLDLSDDEFTVFGQTYATGDDCQGEEGEVAVLKWSAGDFTSEPEVITAGLRNIRFEADGEAYVIAFMRPGDEIPLPPALDTLNAPADLAPGEEAPTFEIPAEGIGEHGDLGTIVVEEDGVVDLGELPTDEP